MSDEVNSIIVLDRGSSASKPARHAVWTFCVPRSQRLSRNLNSRSSTTTRIRMRDRTRLLRLFSRTRSWTCSTKPVWAISRRLQRQPLRPQQLTQHKFPPCSLLSSFPRCPSWLHTQFHRHQCRRILISCLSRSSEPWKETRDVMSRSASSFCATFTQCWMLQRLWWVNTRWWSPISHPFQSRHSRLHRRRRQPQKRQTSRRHHQLNWVQIRWRSRMSEARILSRRRAANYLPRMSPARAN